MSNVAELPAAPARADALQAVIDRVRHARAAAGGGCPRCGSSRTIGWGGFSGRARYRCNACRRTFSDFTGTPVAYSKRAERWGDYARCMVESLSVRAAARRVDVTPPTAFRWRHALLSGLRHAPEALLSGRVELTDAGYRYSDKGSWRRRVAGPETDERRGPVPTGSSRVLVLFGADAAAATLAEVVGVRLLLTAAIQPVLAASVQPGSAIVALRGAYSAYALASRRAGLRFRPALPRWTTPRRAAGRRGTARAAIDRALRLRAAFEAWVARFLGVATSYLPNYLRWSRFLVAAGRTRLAATGWTFLESCCVGALCARTRGRPTFPLNRVDARGGGPTDGPLPPARTRAPLPSRAPPIRTAPGRPRPRAN